MEYNKDWNPQTPTGEEPENPSVAPSEPATIEAADSNPATIEAADGNPAPAAYKYDMYTGEYIGDRVDASTAFGETTDAGSEVLPDSMGETPTASGQTADAVSEAPASSEINWTTPESIEATTRESNSPTAAPSEPATFEAADGDSATIEAAEGEPATNDATAGTYEADGATYAYDSPAYNPTTESVRGGEYARANGYTMNNNYHYEPTAGGYGTSYSSGYSADATSAGNYGSANAGYSADASGAGYDGGNGGYGGASNSYSSASAGNGDNYNGAGSGYGGASGNSYSSASGGYGAGSNYGGANTYGAANTGYQPTGYSTAYAGRAARAEKSYLQITKKGFILVLILCMLLTSAVSVGGFAIWNHYNNNGGGNTYTLTNSKETLSYKSIVEMNENSVVSITTESVKLDAWAQNYVTKGAGSGIVITEDGYIMTCAHVVTGSTKITVTLANGKTFDAKLIAENVNEDIAVLKISASGLDPVTIGDSSKLSVGDQVVAIGNPLGSLSGTATTGIVSALERKLTIQGKTLTLLQTDASINPGNSGGALFNAQGELIGVVVAKSTGSDVEGLGFAIPVNQAKAIADDLIKNGSPAGQDSQSSSSGNSSDSGTEQTDHGKIGIMVTQLTEKDATDAGYTSGAGLYVIRLTAQGAKDGGLEVGDKIVSCNGTSISSHAELQTALAKTKAGDKATIGILRDGKSKTLTVVLS